MKELQECVLENSLICKVPIGHLKCSYCHLVVLVHYYKILFDRAINRPAVTEIGQHLWYYRHF